MDGRTVVKADGTEEPFKPAKLRASLQRSRAKEEEIEAVIAAVEAEIATGMTTEEIYRRAFEILRNMRRGVAARYSLRRALAELGPSGFPFEQFVAEVHRAFGHTAETGQILRGSCGEYEIDVVARDDKEKKVIFSEAKFHNESRTKSDLKVALYVKARFDDLASNNFDGKLPEGYTAEAWIITNTKFTHNALKYGECAGLTLIGWSYPEDKSLEKMVEKAKLEPITALTTLSGTQKQELIANGAVLCRDVHADRSLLRDIGVKGPMMDEVLEEVGELCTIE